MADPFEAALAALGSAPAPLPRGAGGNGGSGGSGSSASARLPPQVELVRQALVLGCEEVRDFREKQGGRVSRRGKDGTRVLALMFLIIDSLPHEALWRSWIAEGEAAGVEVRVCVHAKAPEKVESDWVRQKLVKATYRPKWGSIEITRAMIDLLREGLADDRVSRLALASETCIPIAPMKQVAFELWREEKSWLDYRLKPDNGYDRDLKWGRVGAAVPLEKIAKADQWTCLIREHAEDIVSFPAAAGEELWPLMRDVIASDEIYIPTALCLLGEIPTAKKGEQENGGSNGEDIQVQRVVKRKLTWGDWTVSAKSPATFHSLEPCREWPAAAIQQGCLFARKFAPTSVSIEAWEEWMKERLQAFEDFLRTMPEDERKAAEETINSGREVDPSSLPVPPWVSRSRESHMRGGGGAYHGGGGDYNGRATDRYPGGGGQHHGNFSGRRYRRNVRGAPPYDRSRSRDRYQGPRRRNEDLPPGATISSGHRYE